MVVFGREMAKKVFCFALFFWVILQYSFILNLCFLGLNPASGTNDVCISATHQRLVQLNLFSCQKYSLGLGFQKNIANNVAL